MRHPQPQPNDGTAPPLAIPLLGVDTGLRAAVPTGELATARAILVAPGREVGPGLWAPERLAAGDDALAMLLVRGLVTHEVTVAGRRSAELLGQGDVLHPWRKLDSTIPSTSRWASASAALLAVLDGRFVAAARRWPRLFGVIHDRLGEQLARATTRAAIMGLPRVEQRVLGLFWHLAERWGKVRTDGVVLELALAHELIGQLVGAQRPTPRTRPHRRREHAGEGRARV